MDYNLPFDPYKIVTKDEILNLKKEEEGIVIGDSVDLDFETYRDFFNLWCRRIKRMIDLDAKVNNKRTTRSAILLKHRGFTFDEFLDLYNPHVEFPNIYPFYLQMGIRTDKQRERFLRKYPEDNAQENYIALIQNYKEILGFFLPKRSRLAKIPIESKTMHELIIAGTGYGKSVLMATEVYNDSHKLPKWSQVIIDPHGSFARLVFESKLHKHSDRVIFLDIRMILKGWRWGINALDIREANILEKNNVIDQLVSAFSDVLSKEGGEIRQNVNTIMKKCLEFLLEKGNCTLQDLLDLVCYDEKILKDAQEYDNFFIEDFTKTEASTVKAIRRRLRAIIDDKVLNMILGGNSTFDLEKAINSNKIVIFDLSAVGEESQQVIGKFIMAMVKGYVRRRRKGIDERHTLLKVDEFQNFITGSLSYMLEQLRGYGLHCSLACQSVAQIGAYLQTVKDNTSIKIGKAKYESDIGAVMKVPEKYINRKSRGDNSMHADGLLMLGKHEFLLDVRQRFTVRSFNSPGFLVTSNKYRLTTQEIEDAMEAQLLNYYKQTERKGVEEDDFKTPNDDEHLEEFYVPEDLD